MNPSQLPNSVRPQDDYFSYINAAWLEQNPVPLSENSWGTFYVLRDQAWSAVNQIISDLRASGESTLSSHDVILKKFFTSAFTYDENSAHQLETLRQELAKIEAVSNKGELARYLGEAESLGINQLFSTNVELDDHDSSRQVLRFRQDGLSLPNRDYYLEENESMAEIRQQYAGYYDKVEALFPDVLKDDWQTIIDLEKTIASNSWTDVALRDVEKNYNFYSLAGFKETFANFSWDEYFVGLHWSNPSDHIVVSQPDFLICIIKLLQERPLEEIKVLLRWRVINECMRLLSSEHNDISFDFFDTIISGTKQQKPLWKQVVLQADHLIISEALGKAYAERHFPAESKQAVLGLVDNIRAAYHSRIDRLSWMGEETKQLAHTKLDAIKVFIGFPSVWKDLSDLKFVDDNHLHNVLEAHKFEHAYYMQKIGTRPDEEEWEMSAHTVNAYHHPNRLEIVFPAAILQPPFYDAGASYAANLGGIGAVIGHEFTHGFDDQGAEFDQHGNVNRWQSDEERQAFDLLADNIVRQADKFEVLPGIYLQGKLILGEAIADIGGLELAVEALHARDYTPEDEIELFENFARVECGHTTDERTIELAKKDPHPPSKFRVNAVVGNVDAFYDVYDVTPDDELYIPPALRAHIW